MAEPASVRVVREYKERLARQEAAQMADMARHWVGVQDGLERSIAKLAEQVSKQVAQGKPPTESQLWEMERYQALLAQTRQQVTHYNAYAERAIAEAQRAAMQLGLAQADAAIEATGLRLSFARLPVDAVEAMVAILGEDSPVHDLLRNAYPDAVEGMNRALLNAIAQGWNPRETARAMRDGLDVGLTRALRIARTEQIRAWRESSMARYRQSGVVTGYKRICAKGERTCIACLLLDGTHYDVESDLDDHVNGRCSQIPEVVGFEPPEWETGREWFDDLDGDAQERILGADAYERWQDGDIELNDLVQRTHSETWGDSIGVRPVSEL